MWPCVLWGGATEKPHGKPQSKSLVSSLCCPLCRPEFPEITGTWCPHRPPGVQASLPSGSEGP